VTNLAFDAAKAGGSVDTAVGFPKSREDMYEFYGFIRKQTRDSASQEGGELEFPAGYMFKDVPRWDAEGMDDPVQILLAELDRHNIKQAIVTPYDGPAQRALREYPDRFFAGVNVDPNEGMEALRQIDRAAEEYDLKCVHAFPAGLYPQVAINDKKFYPIYMKCVELDVPFCSTAGVPGPRIPYAPQDVAHIDEVCWFFPELKFVTRHGCEPWADLAVKLLLKWPNLYYSTTAFAPKYYPREIIDFANTRGADKVIWSGYFPAGLTYDRIFSELPAVPFRDHVWPKFLRENAQRVFKLPPTS
jgi:predicted TIM-barrel fold metal-dependent hydrolase